MRWNAEHEWEMIAQWRHKASSPLAWLVYTEPHWLDTIIYLKKVMAVSPISTMVTPEQYEIRQRDGGDGNDDDDDDDREHHKKVTEH